MNKDIGTLASVGGKASRASLTPQQRKEAASNAAKVRWDKARLRKSHVCEQLCRCWKCGKKNYQHSKYSEDKCEFLCYVLEEGKQNWQ